jgi:hypothetical protein
MRREPAPDCSSLPVGRSRAAHRAQTHDLDVAGPTGRYGRCIAPAGPPDRELALYEALIATHPEIERKGASNPYTSLNGNMFTILSPDGSVGIRLAQADRDAFMQQYGTGLHEAHGRVMKEYVAVPNELLARTGELAAYLAKSYEYAKTLKPKPTTRKARRDSA